MIFSSSIAPGNFCVLALDLNVLVLECLGFRFDLLLQLVNELRHLRVICVRSMLGAQLPDMCAIVPQSNHARYWRLRCQPTGPVPQHATQSFRCDR